MILWHGFIFIDQCVLTRGCEMLDQCNINMCSSLMIFFVIYLLWFLFIRTTSISTIWGKYCQNLRLWIVVRVSIRTIREKNLKGIFSKFYTVGEGNGQHTSFWPKVLLIAMILAQSQPILASIWLKSVAHCPHCWK